MASSALSLPRGFSPTYLPTAKVGREHASYVYAYLYLLNVTAKIEWEALIKHCYFTAWQDIVDRQAELDDVMNDCAQALLETNIDANVSHAMTQMASKYQTLLNQATVSENTRQIIYQLFIYLIVILLSLSTVISMTIIAFVFWVKYVYFLTVLFWITTEDLLISLNIF